MSPGNLAMGSGMMNNHTALYFHIVGMRIVDFFRKRGRRPQMVTDEVPDHAAEPEPEGLDDNALRIKSLLGILTERQQMVFKMFYFENMTTGTIAKALKTNPNNVYSDLFHGRKALRAALDAEENKRRQRKP